MHRHFGLSPEKCCPDHNRT